MQQNYSNHRKYVPAYHYVLLLLVLVLIGLSITNFVQGAMACHAGACMAGGCCMIQGLLPLLVSIALLLIAWLMREFATKVQDRAIHAEENFRHFIMTGKPLDSRLTWSQVIALRFAGDDEYLSLTERAISENLKPNDIKKAIKNWREDNHRC